MPVSPACWQAQTGGQNSRMQPRDERAQHAHRAIHFWKKRPMRALSEYRAVFNRPGVVQAPLVAIGAQRAKHELNKHGARDDLLPRAIGPTGAPSAAQALYTVSIPP